MPRFFSNAQRDEGGVCEERPTWEADPSLFPITGAGFSALYDWGLNAPTTSGGRVTDWQSPTGVKGYSGSQLIMKNSGSTGPFQGSSGKPNGKDYALFSGAEFLLSQGFNDVSTPDVMDYFGWANGDEVRQYTVFTVTRPDAFGAGNGIADMPGIWSHTAYWFGLGAGHSGVSGDLLVPWSYNYDGSVVYTLDQATTSGTWKLVTQRRSSEQLRAYLNGAQASETVSAVDTGPQTVGSGLRFGYNDGSTLYFTGGIAFWAAAPGDFSAVRRRDVERYLDNRFLTVASTNYSRSMSENVAAPTDGFSRSLVLSRAQVENVAAPTDARTRAATYARAQAENVAAPTDGSARVVGFSRAQAESVAAPADVVVRVFGAVRSQAENVAAPTDTRARAVTLSRSQAESVSAPTDSFTRAIVLSRAQAENVVAPTDAVSRNVGAARSVAENVGAPTDSSSRSATYARAQTENVVAPTDTRTRAVTYARAQAENVAAPTDVVQRVLGVVRSVAESVAAPTDALARSLVLARSQVEAVSAPTDTFARVYGAVRGLAYSVAAPTDALSRTFGAFRSLAENVSAPTDAFTYSVNGGSVGYSRSISENIAAPTDGFTRVLVLSRAQAENVSAPTDAVSRAYGATRSQAENVAAPTDTTTRAFSGARAQAENVAAPSFSAGRQVGAARSVAENVAAPTDTRTRSVGYARGQAENVAAPTDAVIRSVTLARSVIEIVAAPADVFSRSYGAVRALAFSVPAPTDGFLRALAVIRSVTEDVAAPADVFSRSGGVFAREQAENVPAPSDVFLPLVSGPNFGAGRIVIRALGAFVTFSLELVSGTEIRIAAPAPLTSITTRIEEKSQMIVGNVVSIDFEVRKAGVLIDPGVCAVKVQSPTQRLTDDFTLYTYGTDQELTRRALGKFRIAWRGTERGKWTFVLVTDEGGGVAEGARDGYVDIEASPL